MRTSAPLVVLALAAALGCGDAAPDAAPSPTLGPVDGHDLPRADLARVRAGDPAPDFSLASLDHGVVTLSDFRGERDVILVFYRGHW